MLMMVKKYVQVIKEDQMKESYYPSVTTATQNKPRRESVICNDDILNLIIALETSKDVNEILEDSHIFDLR